MSQAKPSIVCIALKILIFQAPTKQPTELSTLDGSSRLKFQVFQGLKFSPSENKVRSVSAIPYSWYQLVFVRIFMAVMKHCDQSNLGRKRFIQLMLKSGQELKQGRNLEAGADAEAMEGCRLLACSSWFARLAFL